MNRITTVIHELTVDGRKAFIPFVTAGYPDLTSTPGILRALEKAGATIIELGMPFSDPLADGPTIQASSHEAIQSGATPEATFECLQQFRRTSEIPVIIFTYTNLVMRYGVERFMKRLQDAGGDGVLIPDLPLEESGQYRQYAHDHGVHMIFLVSPLTIPRRMKEIEKNSDDFVYCVSTTGVTGVRDRLFAHIEPYLKTVRKNISKPVMVGFGVSSGEDAQKISHVCDGVVVGSAIISVIRQYRGKNELHDKIISFCRNICHGISLK